MTTLDHLAIAARDLDVLVAWWVEATGAEPQPGGQHDGWGTRNVLVGVDDSTYVELIATDPAQPAPARPRPFGIDALGAEEVRLAAVALAVEDLDVACRAVRDNGLEPGEPRAMQRRLADGSVLAWRLALPPGGSLDGVQPFLIEWGTGARHPGRALVPQVSVDRLVLGHPRAGALDGVLSGLAVDDARIVVDNGPPGLRATLSTPSGTVEL